MQAAARPRSTKAHAGYTTLSGVSRRSGNSVFFEAAAVQLAAVDPGPRAPRSQVHERVPCIRPGQPVPHPERHLPPGPVERDPPKWSFGSLLFKLFNRVETWELLEHELGTPNIQRILIRAIRPRPFRRDGAWRQHLLRSVHNALWPVLRA